jgi:hypothetical protein
MGQIKVLSRIHGINGRLHTAIVRSPASKAALCAMASIPSGKPADDGGACGGQLTNQVNVCRPRRSSRATSPLGWVRLRTVTMELTVR